MSERRDLARRRVIGVRFRSPTLNGRIVDVSGRGLGLETPQPLNVGEEHRVTVSYHGRSVVADGKVCWTERVSEVMVGSSPTPVFRAGLQLTAAAR